MPFGGFRLNTFGQQAAVAAGYTVPTAAFTSDANTLALLKFENNVTDSTGLRTYTNTNCTFNSTTKQFGTHSLFSSSSASVTRFVRSNTVIPGPTAQNCTIECWIYATSYTDQEYAFGSGVPKGLGLTAGSDWGWSLGITNSGFLRTFWFQGGYQAITSTVTVPLNQWNHIVFQHTTADDLSRLGLNGEWVAEANTMTGTIASNQFTVGTVRLNSPNNYFDEVRYSNTLRY